MAFEIDSIDNISKLLAFIRVGAKADFKVQAALVGEAILRCHAFAKQQGIRIEISSASFGKMLEAATVGAVLGATVGMMVGGPIATIKGAAFGACVGAALANVRLVISFDEKTKDAIFSLT